MFSVAFAVLEFVEVGGPAATSWKAPTTSGRVTVVVNPPFGPTVTDASEKVWLFVSVRATVDPATKSVPVTVIDVLEHGEVVLTDNVGAVT
jgi:hypothetical protein